MTFLTDSEKQRIATIHASGYRGVFAITGGGGAFLGKLLTVPGASQTILEMIVPYSLAAMRDFLQTMSAPCCAATARKLAVAAWYRAQRYAEVSQRESLFGLGLTAVLATNYPHRGRHRVYLALHTSQRTICYSRFFDMENASREKEELELTAWALEILEDLVQERLGRILPQESQEAASDWQELLSGKRATIGYLPSEGPGKLPTGLFPGSFNPMHEGHCRMLAVARELLGGEVGLELAICNADKPPLDYVEIARRLEGIWARSLPSTPVFLTATPSFEQKAIAFPGTTFLVGTDTIKRIAETRFYGGETARMEMAIRKIVEKRCHFLVFGRWDGVKFVTLKDTMLPPILQSICREIPESLFREDISSTLLRRQNREDLL